MTLNQFPQRCNIDSLFYVLKLYMKLTIVILIKVSVRSVRDPERNLLSKLRFQKPILHLNDKLEGKIASY